jgi:hypothetical protein
MTFYLKAESIFIIRRVVVHRDVQLVYEGEEESKSTKEEKRCLCKILKCELVNWRPFSRILKQAWQCTGSALPHLVK